MNDIFNNEYQIGRVRKSRLYVILGGVIGAVLGALLVYFIQGQFPIEVVAGAVFAAFLLLLYEFFANGNRNGNLPETDERVSRNAFHFLSHLSHIALAILILGLAVFSLFGDGSISIVYLWVFFFIYILIGAVGGIIVRNR